MAIHAAERHLLFGILALQNGLVDQGNLVAAFQDWTRDKLLNLTLDRLPKDDSAQPTALAAGSMTAD